MQRPLGKGYITYDTARVRIKPVTEMIVSQTDHVFKVCTILILKYSFTSQKPPSLTCEKINDPAPAATPNSPGETTVFSNAMGPTIPATGVIARVAEPVASRINAASSH